MADFFRYDFGYSWPWSYGHLAAAGAFALIGILAILLGWRKWTIAASAVATLWALAAFVTFDCGLHVPAELPTRRFLASGWGRVLDGGAGSGRATIMVLKARPQARVVALDLFQDGDGIIGNGPDRLRANVRAAGAEDRLDIRKGDLRRLPFDPESFDAAVSSFAIDHLGRQGSQQSIAEMARVLKPGGQFLLMVLNTDAYVKFAYPLIHLHMYYGHGASPDRWQAALTAAGFDTVEQGTRPATQYFLAEKRPRAARLGNVEEHCPAAGDTAAMVEHRHRAAKHSRAHINDRSFPSQGNGFLIVPRAAFNAAVEP